MSTDQILFSSLNAPKLLQYNYRRDPLTINEIF